MSKHRNFLAENPEIFHEDSEEAKVRQELERLGIENEECPEVCPHCGSELAEAGGYVGEAIVYCPNKDCATGILWEDNEDAIRRAM